MIQSTDLPPKDTAGKSPKDKNKKTFEPPINTDEHRLKADKEQHFFNTNEFIFFMSLSVFIGVHRWLKIVFNFLIQNLSVCTVGRSL